jgi:hypothetical protein
MNPFSSADGVPNAGNANAGIQAGTGQPSVRGEYASLKPESASVVNAPLSQSPVSGTRSFSIPDADLPVFSKLPEAVRVDVRRKLKAFEAVHASGKVMPACKAQAALFAGARGFSPSTLRCAYYAFLRSGDWRTLIDRARAGQDFIDRQEIALPGEFVEFWRGLCERNQRKSRAAHRELLRIWRSRHDTMGQLLKSIPGYLEWPAAEAGTGIPFGWSESNLYRCAPTRFELTAARIGRLAAADYRPKVFSTRFGLRVGQFYFFDDQEYDVKTNFPGNSKAMRPLGLNSLDLFSACLFAYSFKPTIWNQEDQTKQKLREVDMLWFTVHVLTSFGFRDDEIGTILGVEHGTAAISEQFEQRIFDATHGCVRVNRSGITRQNSFDGLFEGSSRGNFRFKAALESIFGLVRNEMAMLPGQVGPDRLRAPDDTAGRDRYNNSLIRAALAMPPERAALLRLPFLDWGQFTGLCLDIYARINARTDHELEGWVKSGLVVNEWRVNDQQPWLPQATFLALPAPEQAVMRQLIESSPRLSRARKLSPQEVFQSGQGSLQKVKTFLLPVLLGPEFGTERRVHNGLFEWDDQSISPDPIRFLARSNNAQLPEGEKYLTYLNPFSPTELVLCNAKGGYVGSCQPWASPCHSDVERIHRQMGMARKIEAELLAPVARRGADLSREKLAMHQHNAAVLAGKATADPRLRNFKGTMDDLVEDEAPSADAPRESTGDLSDFVEAPQPTSTAQPSNDDLSAEGLL